METVIYMVRHAESDYADGTERSRGLTERGKRDVERVTEVLAQEGIEVLISSPYARAVLTLEGLANRLGLPIRTEEDLRERHFADENGVVPNEEFQRAFEATFADYDLAMPGGESNRVCQERAIRVFSRLLEEHRGKRIAVGTHGNVMTLIMNYYDARFGWDFMNAASKPDIYQMRFDGSRLLDVIRLWSVRQM